MADDFQHRGEPETDGMNPARHSVPVLLISMILCGAVAAGPAPGETVVIGPFAGHDAKLHPDNVAPYPIRFYGTDLGWTYEHQGQIHILFGDTWATESTYYIEESTGARNDDGFGTVDLEEWSDTRLFGPENIPLIRLGQHRDSGEMSAIDPGHAMEGYKTPVGGFSNGEREFGIFYLSKPQACRQDGDCSNGLSCDHGLGYSGREPQDDAGITLACIDGTQGCHAEPMPGEDGAAVAGSGLCIDATSSNWAPTQAGRIGATGLRHLVGLRSLEDPRKYTVISQWLTTKFINPAVRTVTSFSPAAAVNDVQQDFRPVRTSGGNSRVFVWGRPTFVGVGATGRDLGLYFAYVDMPRAPDYAWSIHYFAGTQADGGPLFSALEQEAAALDLDYTVAGIQSREVHDIVDQMSVAWVAHMKKWVMFYGGGMISLPSEWMPHCGLVEFFARAECQQVVIGNGAVRMRTADTPWGPWTPPQDVFVGGDPHAVPLERQYAEGGVLYHPACSGQRCAASSGRQVQDDYGWLYAANIIAEWITPAGKGVEIFWNVSTSNPYHVLLLRTRIE